MSSGWSVSGGGGAGFDLVNGRRLGAADGQRPGLGFELAHEKAVELRMAGFKNVVMSLAEAPESS